MSGAPDLYPESLPAGYVKEALLAFNKETAPGCAAGGASAGVEKQGGEALTSIHYRARPAIHPSSTRLRICCHRVDSARAPKSGRVKRC